MSTNLNILQAEEALAKRWLRGGHIPIAAWQWLGGSAPQSATSTLTPEPAPNGLIQALAQFARPLAHNSSPQQSQSLATALEQMAHLCGWCYAHVGSAASAACTERMLAAAVLPLYRGLAVGAVENITNVMKLQLADALALSALECEFGEDLRELVTEGLGRNQSPYEVIQRTLEFDLSKLAETLLIACQQHPSKSTSPADDHAKLKSSPRPDWGQPQVLWRLAGELIADRAEFIVPRTWIDVPVPWSEASEHWRAVADALRRVDSHGSIQLTSSSPTANALSPTGQSASHTSHAAAAIEVTTALRMDGPVGSDPAMPTSSSQRAGHSADHLSGNEAPLTSIDAAKSMESIDDITRLKLEIEIADSVDALVQASRGATRLPASDRGVRTDGASGLAGSRNREPEFIIPKVIIAEVRSHNDQAFVAIVRRQVALCRAEERTMSLVAVRVEPDGEEDAMPTLESLGLACWQQHLVNWMADHPEIHDPYAFVSSEGELILCLMDVERNTTTGLLRQGLIEVLTGQSLGGESNSSLSRVSTPARYHSGIGSITSPTAGFEAEQLIEATYRCLSAAQRHGKASIKSIEVF